MRRYRRLTHADSRDDWRGEDGQGHASRDGQVPLVTGRLLQLVVGVDLRRRRGRNAGRVQGRLTDLKRQEGR